MPSKNRFPMVLVISRTQLVTAADCIRVTMSHKYKARYKVAILGPPTLIIRTIAHVRVKRRRWILI